MRCVAEGVEKKRKRGLVELDGRGRRILQVGLGEPPAWVPRGFRLEYQVSEGPVRRESATRFHGEDSWPWTDGTLCVRWLSHTGYRVMYAQLPWKPVPVSESAQMPPEELGVLFGHPGRDSRHNFSGQNDEHPVFLASFKETPGCTGTYTTIRRSFSTAPSIKAVSSHRRHGRTSETYYCVAASPWLLPAVRRSCPEGINNPKPSTCRLPTSDSTTTVSSRANVRWDW